MHDSEQNPSEQNPYAPPESEPQESPSLEKGGRLQYATLGQRFLGAIIDGLIMVPIVLVTVFLVALADGLSIKEDGLGIIFFKFAEAGFLTNLVTSLLFMGAYMGVQWNFWSSTSQSIGKKLMKTQIVNLDGTPADVKTIAFKRYLPIIVATSFTPENLSNVIAFLDAVLIFRRERNCLHDDIAKTRVVIYSKP